MNAITRFLNSLVLTIAVTISPAVAGPAEDQIEQLEQQRYAALIAGNWAAFDALLADEFFYNQAGGKSVPKAAYLATLRTGAVKVHQAMREEPTIRRYGDVVVVTGITHVDVTLNGEDKTFHSRYLHVWVKKENDWKLVARQATYLPANN
jgi:ketosteroid isomerase-like protein